MVNNIPIIEWLKVYRSRAIKIQTKRDIIPQGGLCFNIEGYDLMDEDKEIYKFDTIASL